MYATLRLVTCLLAICLPIYANILRNEHLKLVSASQNPLNFDVKPFKWNQSTEEEIVDVGNLNDELNVDVITIKPDLVGEKSRFKREDPFIEQNLCEISEDELNSLNTILSSNNLISSTLQALQSSSNVCDKLKLQIKNLIGELKNNFIDLKNIQVTKVDIEMMKRNYEDKIKKLTLKIDEIKRSSTQKTKTKLDALNIKIQDLTQEINNLVRDLRNERLSHRNTKIQLCIAEIRSDKEVQQCSELLNTEYKNETLINYIVTTAYENKEQNIVQILKVSRDTPCFNTFIATMESLINIMEKKGDKTSPMMLEIHQNIDFPMKLNEFNALNYHVKSRFENARRRAQNSVDTVVNIWAGEILNYRYSSVLQFERSYEYAFSVIAELLAEKTYLGNLDYAEKFISYLKESRSFNTDTQMTKRLFDLMKSNHHLSTPQGMQLAWYIKHILGTDTFSSLSDAMKQQWYYMKNGFPCGVFQLFFTDGPEVKSMLHNEYLYAASGRYNYGDHRRSVFTWRRGHAVRESNWRFETTDAKYFKMYNVHYKEYLYAANNELKFDRDRRSVLTWSDSSFSNDKFYWEIIPRDANTFYIKNKEFGEYMYSADYKPYDGDRRRVFTWGPNRDLVGNWNIGDC